MRNRAWSKTMRRLGRNLEDMWDDLVHDDSSQIEREFNRLIGRLQRHHGYSPERALDELQDQWHTYSKRTRNMFDRQMSSFPLRKQKKSRRWPWVVGSLIIAFYLVRALVRQRSSIDQQTRSHYNANGSQHAPFDEQKPINKQKPRHTPEERTSVEERSRESFPASDPPATW